MLTFQKTRVFRKFKNKKKLVLEKKNQKKMLSICTSLELDDPRFEESVQSLWRIPFVFEHVIIVNNCSVAFKENLHNSVSPRHVITVVVEDPISVAKPGLESLLTPIDNPHSTHQFRQRCVKWCTARFYMHVDASFIATPEWISWLIRLDIQHLTEQRIMVSMHQRTPNGHTLLSPKMFNFQPPYRRHYWWELPVKTEGVQHLTNLPTDAYISEWTDAAVHNPEPWFLNQDPVLESTLSYAQTLLPPESDAPNFIAETAKLFDPEGKFRDSKHQEWVNLGSSALKALRGEVGDSWRSNFHTDIQPDQAQAYWSQIFGMEFEVADLQPICSACDDDGGMSVQVWPDGLQASAQTLKNVWHALFVLDHNRDVETVVEVGGGYGGFAKAFLLCAKLCDRLVNSYSIIETPALQLLSERYLEGHHSVVDMLDPQKAGADMDESSLLLSFEGISELSPDLKSRYLAHTVPRAKSVCMLWGCTELPEEFKQFHTINDWCSPEAHVLVYGSR